MDENQNPPPDETPPVVDETPPAGLALYAAYRTAAAGRSHTGEPLPAFEDLTEARQAIWNATAAAL